MKLSERKSSPPKILLFGPPGTGKTVFTTSIGKYGRIIDIDNGLLSAVTTADKWQSTRAEIDVKQAFDSDIKTTVAFDKARSFIESACQEVTSGEMKVLIVDSLTSLSEFALRQVAVQNNLVGKPFQIQHWGMAFSLIEQVLIALKAAKCAVILIAHQQKSMEDEEVKLDICMPGQKLAGKLPSYFDEIWYSKVKLAGQGRYDFVIQTKPTSSVMCRSRANLPDNINQNVGLLEVFKLMGYPIESIPTTQTPLNKPLEVKTL